MTVAAPRAASSGRAFEIFARATDAFGQAVRAPTHPPTYGRKWKDSTTRRTDALLDPYLLCPTLGVLPMRR